MKTVAIISEYNPFHSGHEYQLKKIREEFGEDTAIVAVMSGNFTQRGEVAFASKAQRAKAAVLAGVNLVLELPFPFSSSSAEIFAKSGVKIADSIGADYLSFGSESGDINELVTVADVIASAEFEKVFKALGENKALGYPERCEAAYKSIVPSSKFEFSSNNILAIEYIKAINELNTKITPHTIKRLGAEYTAEEVKKTSHQSAMALRGAIKNNEDVFEYFPSAVKDMMAALKEEGELPCDIQKISSAFISYLRLNPPSQAQEIHDAGDGLYNRLYNESFKANDISTLLLRSETKNYTKARIRRALLNVFFGVTSSDVKTLPMYTQILAMDSTGTQILKKTRKTRDIQVLTKPSDYKAFGELELRQKQLSDKADSIFELTKPIPKDGASALTFTPYIKK